LAAAVGRAFDARPQAGEEPVRFMPRTDAHLEAGRIAVNTAQASRLLTVVHALGPDDLQLVRQTGGLKLTFQPFCRRAVADSLPGPGAVLAVAQEYRQRNFAHWAPLLCTALGPGSILPDPPPWTLEPGRIKPAASSSGWNRPRRDRRSRWSAGVIAISRSRW